MPYRLIGQDYRKVLDTIFENDPEKFLNPLRCHEMAYLISIGMNRIGYQTTLQDGLYQDSFNLHQHSWVLCDNLYLSYFFVKKLGPETYAQFWNEIVRFFWQKWRYTPKQINYSLAEGIDDFAEKVFGSLKFN